MKREFIIKQVAHELGVLRSRIDYLSKINLRDQNVVAEYHLQEILNIAYNLKLESSNAIVSNAVAIDLQDKVNAVAVQVTASSGRAKIQETIDKFISSGLHEKYEMLWIVILGSKQKNYKSFRIDNDFYFSPSEHIIDFGDIVSKLSTLPLTKIEKILRLLQQDSLKQPKRENPRTAHKRVQAIKKKLGKLLQNNLTLDELLIYSYIPYRRFIYDSLIVRSIEDKAFPSFEVDENFPDGTWYKAGIHNFYEYGIEVRLPFIAQLVVNDEGRWNYLNDRSGKDVPEGVSIVHASVVHRIPYEYIVELEMEPDGYYGYPTLWLEFRDRKPYSEELPVVLGFYKNERNCGMARYFENYNRDVKL